MAHALVVDDEPAICRCFETLFQQLECDVSVAASAEEALLVTAARDVDVLVLDVRLPGMDGLAAISKFRQHTAAPIIVMTAHGDLSTAVTAVKEGAFEYLPKPFELDHVTVVVRRALAECSSVVPPSNYQHDDARIIGNSPPIQQLFRQIALAAQHDAPVLITGESGTGKELVANAIHRHSPRAEKKIVPVHLASVSEALMERELFGHSSGAFTGADSAQDGLMARADEGSLFLDEIGEASSAVQVKLLRTIETGEFYRVGSSTAERSNFRLIAATNRPMEFLRSSEHFRSDFFFRLSTIHIHVPPLRERQEDIPPLADYFLNGPNGGTRSFSDDALQVLRQHTYSGNVRELRNIVVSAAFQTPATVIEATHIQFPSTVAVADSHVAGDLRAAAQHWVRTGLEQKQPNLLATATEILETELIEAVMEQTDQNRSAAAKLLGIHRETLREKIERYSTNK